MRRAHTNVAIPMMTARMTTVTETQMAIKTFFCGRGVQGHSLGWGGEASRVGDEGREEEGRGGRGGEGWGGRGCSPSGPSSGSPGQS